MKQARRGLPRMGPRHRRYLPDAAAPRIAARGPRDRPAAAPCPPV